MEERKTILCRTDAKTHEQLRSIAFATGRSINNLLLHLIVSYCKENAVDVKVDKVERKRPG